MRFLPDFFSKSAEKAFNLALKYKFFEKTTIKFQLWDTTKKIYTNFL
jgi:hypothetical protein